MFHVLCPFLYYPLLCRVPGHFLYLSPERAVLHAAFLRQFFGIIDLVAFQTHHFGECLPAQFGQHPFGVAQFLFCHQQAVVPYRVSPQQVESVAYRVVHVAEVLPPRSHPVERIAVGGQFGYVVPLAVLFRQFVQYGMVGGGHAQQDDDCLVVLVCRQCRRFRQASERVAHMGAQPPVLAGRFKFQVVVLLCSSHVTFSSSSLQDASSSVSGADSSSDVIRCSISDIFYMNDILFVTINCQPIPISQIAMFPI